MNGKMLYHAHQLLLRVAHLKKKKSLLFSVGKCNKEEMLKLTSHQVIRLGLQADDLCYSVQPNGI